MRSRFLSLPTRHYSDTSSRAVLSSSGQGQQRLPHILYRKPRTTSHGTALALAIFYLQSIGRRTKTDRVPGLQLTSFEGQRRPQLDGQARPSPLSFKWPRLSNSCSCDAPRRLLHIWGNAFILRLSVLASASHARYLHSYQPPVLLPHHTLFQLLYRLTRCPSFSYRVPR